MSIDKQIKKIKAISQEIQKTGLGEHLCDAIAVGIYDAGYRKASDVAEEIFAEINSLRDEYSMGDIEYPDFLFRLGKIEKKYTESEKENGKI